MRILMPRHSPRHLRTPNNTQAPNALSPICWQKKLFNFKGGNLNKFKSHRLDKPPKPGQA